MCFDQIQNMFMKIMVGVEKNSRPLSFVAMLLVLLYHLIQFMLQKMLIHDGVNEDQMVRNIDVVAKVGSRKICLLIDS